MVYVVWGVFAILKTPFHPLAEPPQTPLVLFKRGGNTRPTRVLPAVAVAPDTRNPATGRVIQNTQKPRNVLLSRKVREISLDEDGRQRTDRQKIQRQC